MLEKHIHKILVANRAEPVRRAIRTFQGLGITSVSIAIKEDLASDWVAESDECALVSSYLNVGEIVAAAKRLQCDAVWPGWGFLSENAEFAEAVIKQGLAWIGPSPDVIAKMGSKSLATGAAQKAGLKTIPEISLEPKETAEVSLDELKASVKEIGFPVLLKPALGGGGKGQEVIDQESGLAEAWAKVYQINKNQFGSGPILVQRFFTTARHIETQILADEQGHVVVLGERDCSIQRRNQKVIEESPSPALNDGQRAALIEASASFARQVGYANAGTIEFLYSEGGLYFLEMNTRLQVEHPVTEETTRIMREGKEERIDLVREMVFIAEGKDLSFGQSQVLRKGHAIEARLYAEDPEKDFQPAPGRIHDCRMPQCSDTRVDAAFSKAPFDVNPHFDSMIAKVISWGEDRAKAISNLKEALEKTSVAGVPTNISLCKKITEESQFQEGDYHTNYLKNKPELLCDTIDEPGPWLAIGAALEYHKAVTNLRSSLLSSHPTSLQHVLAKIPDNGVSYEVHLKHQKARLLVCETAENSFRISTPGWEFCLKIVPQAGNDYVVVLPDDKVLSASFYATDSFKRHLCLQGRSMVLDVFSNGKTVKKDPHACPMTGALNAVCVAVGDTVKKDQELYQIEAMKMMTSVKAVHDGVVLEILKNPSDLVKAEETVVLFSSEEALHDDSFVEKEKLGPAVKAQKESALSIIENYFLGYDVSEEKVDSCLERIVIEIASHQISGDTFALAVAQILETYQRQQKLFLDSEHILTFVAEQGDHAIDLIPAAKKEELEDFFSCYGISSLNELKRNSKLLIRFFQSFRNKQEAKQEKLIRLLSLCQHTGSCHGNLAEPLVAWLKTKPILNETDKNDIWALLYLLNPEKYYEVGNLPIALEFLHEFRMSKRNPAYDLDLSEYDKLKEDLDKEQTQGPLCFEGFPAPLLWHLNKWFQNFHGRKFDLPEPLAKKDIHLFEINSVHQENTPPRFVVLALVSNVELQKTSHGTVTLPAYEESAILAYRALRLVQRGKPHRPNSVFLLSKEQGSLLWDHEGGLSTEAVKQVAARVGGFSEGIQIQSTEVVLPLVFSSQAGPQWSIIELRHDQNKNIISRPPFLLEEKAPLEPQDKESQMNEKLQRMGKLLNKDRAKLLFDDGAYQELFFPEIDDEPGVALNVYEGTVHSIPTLAYAGDFRYRGGALGEREGKKLASVVVLAYLMNKPLVAFHDGAGANIKESVASLGWAGAYFGANAHTGGFSNPEKFSEWFKGHIGREYFEKALNHFGLTKPIDQLVQNVSRQLLHFHLHVGATVGMLVYGASIGSLSLMNDQTESYRVLTGAQTVKKVLGEKSTNYSLGGARAHAEKSGDIEFVFSSEENVVQATKDLITLFCESQNKHKIERNEGLPVFEIPKSSGIICGRDVIKAHVDQGRFYETRSLLRQAKNILTGYARMAGVPVSIAATATDYGLNHANAFKKVTRLFEAAQETGSPFVVICGDQWDITTHPLSKELLQAREELCHILTRASVPKISVALGARSLEQSLHQHMDLCVYVKRGNETDEELACACHMSALVFDNLTEAFDHVATILSFVIKGTKVDEDHDSILEEQAIASFPKALDQVYEIREVINTVFDAGSFVEFWQHDKLPLVVGLARIGGVAVGVIADNPQVESGAQNMDSIIKFTKMNRFCEKYELPLIELNDSPAFKPGSEQEHKGIQGVGGRSIREECLSRNPKVAVTLRQNYGGRFIHANLITLGPPRMALVCKDAKVGVMGSKGAVGVLYAKQLAALPLKERLQAETGWQQEYEIAQLNPENVVRLGYAKEMIEAKDLRFKIHEALLSLMHCRGTARRISTCHPCEGRDPSSC